LGRASGLCAAKRRSGELRGGKENAREGPRAAARGAERGAPPAAPPSNLDLSGAVKGAGGQPRRTIVTWLILPVVICLF
jgi:hypothetical protein